MLTWRN